MSKFFINPTDIHHDIINITGEDVNHIKKVLRSRVGDNINVCDGIGNDYVASIQSLEADVIRTKIVSSKKNDTEPPVNITLYQGLPKSDKMDFIIQKCIELGVKRIVPVITEHTVVRIDSKKDAESKVTRWRRISLEASKQCNRGMVPNIEYPIGFDEAVKLLREFEMALIPYEKETRNKMREMLYNRDIKEIAVIIGPEGGFSENEIKKAVNAGIKSVSLGPRILRTETAGLSVLSILMYELGDVGR